MKHCFDKTGQESPTCKFEASLYSTQAVTGDGLHLVRSRLNPFADDGQLYVLFLTFVAIRTNKASASVSAPVLRGSTVKRVSCRFM